MVNDDPTKENQTQSPDADKYAPIPAVAEASAQKESDTGPHKDISKRQQRIRFISKRRRRERRKRTLKFWIDCAAALATVAIATFTLVYVHYSSDQANSLKKQLQDFESVEGAMLNVGQPKFDTKEGNIQIDIQNTGHLSAIDPVVTLYEARMRRPENVTFENHKFGKELPAGDNPPIAPGTNPTSVIDLPNWSPDELAAILQGKETIIFGGIMDYQNGFGRLISFHYCFETVYITSDKSIAWIACPAEVYKQLRDINENDGQK